MALWTLSGTTRVSQYQKVHFAIFWIFWCKMYGNILYGNILHGCNYSITDNTKHCVIHGCVGNRIAINTRGPGYMTRQVHERNRFSDGQFSWNSFLPSVLWRCWLGGRKGIRPVKNWVMGIVAWLCVWVEVQMCTWPSWCHCHSLSLAAVNPDWFYLPGWFYLSGTSSPM